MKLKITNKGKFIRSITFIIILILTIIFFISNNTLSYGEVNYQSIYIMDGDTLWNLAKAEQKTNKYYTNKSTREIVEDLIEINHLSNTSLKVGNELKIPSI